MATPTLTSVVPGAASATVSSTAPSANPVPMVVTDTPINDLRASTSNIKIDGISNEDASPGSSASASPQSSPSHLDGEGSGVRKGKKEPVNLREIDPMDLKVVEYNEGRSFAIYGPATRLYVQDLKGMHAVFSKWLNKVESPGWSISFKRKDEVMAWYQKIQSDDATIDLDAIEQYHAEKAERRTTASAAISNVPTITGQNGSSSGGRFGMQSIAYKVPRPHVGLKATLKVGDATANYVVESVSDWNGSTVEAIIHPAGDKNTKSKIVAVRNAWKVWGFNEDHTIRFGN